jgi:tetratricopeptide (TPR) repeat protein
MGKYSRILSVLILLLCTALIRAEVDRVAQWIDQLSDPDPEVRERAATRLLEQGESARPALVTASRSPRPAIASEASAILMKLPWHRPGDSDVIVNALRGYGEKTPDERANVLLSLGNSNQPDEIAAMLRVLPIDPSPRVRWTAAIGVGIGPGWDEPIKTIEKTDAPALRMLLGRNALRGDEPKSKIAAKLIAQAVDDDAEAVYDLDATYLLRLFDIAAALNLHSFAGRALETALDTMDPETLVVERNNKPQDWPDKEARARAKWHFAKDAESRNDLETVRAHLDKLLAFEPSDMSLFLDVLPLFESAKTPPDKVEAYFKRVYDKQLAELKQFPADPVHKNDLAWLLARSGRQLQEAHRLATEAVNAAPDVPAYLDTLAEVKFRLGDVQEAIRLEEKAISLDPKTPFLKEQIERFRKGLAPTTAPIEN